MGAPTPSFLCVEIDRFSEIVSMAMGVFDFRLVARSDVAELFDLDVVATLRGTGVNVTDLL